MRLSTDGAGCRGKPQAPQQRREADWPVARAVTVSGGGLWTRSPTLALLWGAEVVSHPDSPHRSLDGLGALSTPPPASGRVGVREPTLTFVDRTACAPCSQASSCPASGGTGWGQQGKSLGTPHPKVAGAASAAEVRLLAGHPSHWVSSLAPPVASSGLPPRCGVSYML